jgi:hypothetical protein
VSKYDPLFRHLCQAGDQAVTMSFDEIELLVGPLPSAASTSATWWANESAGRASTQARAWTNAGREVERVDRRERIVRFSRPGWRRGA